MLSAFCNSLENKFDDMIKESTLLRGVQKNGVVTNFYVCSRMAPDNSVLSFARESKFLVLFTHRPQAQENKYQVINFDV